MKWGMFNRGFTYQYCDILIRTDACVLLLEAQLSGMKRDSFESERQQTGFVTLTAGYHRLKMTVHLGAPRVFSNEDRKLCYVSLRG